MASHPQTTREASGRQAGPSKPTNFVNSITFQNQLERERERVIE